MKYFLLLFILNMQGELTKVVVVDVFEDLESCQVELERMPTYPNTIRACKPE